MEDHDFEKMTPFDQLISTQSLQILKLLIPYTPPENQRFLAVYTKFLELQHTIDFFQRFHSDVYSQDFKKKTFSPFHIIQEIRPYIPAQFGETFDMLMNMMDMMEVFQNMNEGISAKYKKSIDCNKNLKLKGKFKYDNNAAVYQFISNMKKINFTAMVDTIYVRNKNDDVYIESVIAGKFWTAEMIEEILDFYRNIVMKDYETKVHLEIEEMNFASGQDFKDWVALSKEEIDKYLDFIEQ